MIFCYFITCNIFLSRNQNLNKKRDTRTHKGTMSRVATLFILLLRSLNMITVCTGSNYLIHSITPRCFSFFLIRYFHQPYRLYQSIQITLPYQSFVSIFITFFASFRNMKKIGFEVQILFFLFFMIDQCHTHDFRIFR